jgi:hypothetical protein
MEGSILSGITTEFFKPRKFDYLNLKGNVNVLRMENGMSRVVNYLGMLSSKTFASHGLGPQQLLEQIKNKGTMYKLLFTYQFK